MPNDKPTKKTSTKKKPSSRKKPLKPRKKINPPVTTEHKKTIEIITRKTHLSDQYPLETKLFAISLHMQGYSTREIARQLNVNSHVTVYHWINNPKLLDDVSLTGDVQQLKSALTNKILLKSNHIINKITDEDIENATLQQKATSFGILTDKRRLLDGESTENISSIVNYQKKTNDDQNELEGRLSALDKKINDMIGDD